MLKSKKQSDLLPVFEATVGPRKYLCDASPKVKELRFLIEVTGKSPFQQAIAHGMRIVNRDTVSKQVILYLRKIWYAAMDDKKIKEKQERAEKRRLSASLRKKKRRN